MSTTAILLEFLLSGLQAALWLVLLILTFFEIGWSSLDKIKGFESMVAVVLLPFVYPLGVFADNLADYCLKGWAGKIRQKHINDQNFSAFRLLITTRHDWLSSYFDYMRVRTRICRSTALNCLMLSFILPAFIIVRLQSFLGGSRWVVAFAAFAIGAGFTFLATWSWYQVTNTFHQRVALGFSVRFERADDDTGPR